MWLFMYLCYALSVLTLAGLTATVLQGFSQSLALGASHPSFGFLVTVVYLFTETLTIFFFVGTGSNVREFVGAHKLDQQLVARIKAVRHRVTTRGMLNMVLVMGTAILGGAVAGRNLQQWIHGAIAIVAYGHFLYLLVSQHQAFRLATDVVKDMAAESTAPGSKPAQQLEHEERAEPE